MSPIPFFLGHHKAGTRYVGAIMESFSTQTGLRYATLNNPKWFGFDVAAALQDAERPFVNFMNADYAYLAPLGDFRGFHVVRDPRDIAVSAYFSHLHSHSTDWWPELAQHRRRLQALDFEDGLMADMEFTESLPTDGFEITVFPAMDRWNYADPRILEIRFEELMVRPFEVLSRAFGHVGVLGEDAGSRLEILGRCVEENSFVRLSGGRQVGQVDDRHHFRSGRPGQWRERFTSRHAAWFKDRYPDLLVRLGYESGPDW